MRSGFVAVQIDNNPIWRTPGTAAADKTKMMLAIAPSAAPQFVHQITTGTTLRLYFDGTEQRPVDGEPVRHPWRLAAVQELRADGSTRRNRLPQPDTALR